MKSPTAKSLLAPYIGLALALATTLSSNAQTDSTVLGLPTRVENEQTEVQQKRVEEVRQQDDAVLQLRDIQASLSTKKSALSRLQKQAPRASSAEVSKLETEIANLSNEIELLEKTFEQVAIGGVDLSVFGVEKEEFDWREELVLIVKPLIENVKGLTEKPRKMESLRRVIQGNSKALKTTIEAEKSIETMLAMASDKGVESKLENLRSQWQRRAEDLEREIQLARYQLDSLQGKNTPWIEIFKSGAYSFVNGRGLTLLLSLLAAVSVWLLMRGLLWITRKRSQETTDRSTKTYYRLAAYAYRLLTVVLISVAVLMVFYLRQDLLLLAITAVILFGAVLALHRVLPTYVTEGRILLNMGAIRERERVIYRGVPWEVKSINMFSSFVNPELRGNLKIPISQMHDMISRPSFGEDWFVSSEGDWVLDADNNPLQVIKQSVDMVELQDLNSVSFSVPTADYFCRGYANLSRTEFFRIALVFGIDYSTQTLDVAHIEESFARGIQAAFKDSPYAEHVLHVGCDFHSAGDSSLNYLMLTKFDPAAAQYYNRIKRQIQRACVKVCSDNNWPIPFPQMSVHLSQAKTKADPN